MKKMNSPTPKAKIRTKAMSKKDTLATFSKKLDLKISWKLMGFLLLVC